MRLLSFDPLVDIYQRSAQLPAGDNNGDGFDDGLLAPGGLGPNGSGAMVFAVGGLDASFNLAELNGSNGLVINGAGGEPSNAGCQRR